MVWQWSLLLQDIVFLDNWNVPPWYYLLTAINRIYLAARVRTFHRDPIYYTRKNASVRCHVRPFLVIVPATDFLLDICSHVTFPEPWFPRTFPFPVSIPCGFTPCFALIRPWTRLFAQQGDKEKGIREQWMLWIRMNLVSEPWKRERERGIGAFSWNLSSQED